MKINFYTSFRLSLGYLFLLIISTGANLFAQAPGSTIFKDDFDRATFGSSWQADESWSIVRGSAYNFVDGVGGKLRTTAGFSEASYIIETTAMGFTANHFRVFRITFGQDDLSNQQLYQLSYTAWFGGRLTLSRSTDNLFDPDVLDEVAVFPNLGSTQWYKFKIARYESGLIQVYVDNGAGYNDTPLLEAIDLTYPALGHLGWQVDTEAFAEDFFVDWITADKPPFEKPAIREKPLEDSLITQVSANSGKLYKVKKLVPGVKQLIDRDYTITSVPAYLTGVSFIQTANDDKLNVADSFLTFFLKKPAIVYVGYDARAVITPAWLNEWTKTGDTIGTSDEKGGYLNIYSKLFNNFGELYPFPAILGGNMARPAKSENTNNYLVAAIKPPEVATLQAEDALLSGAVVANNHTGFNGTGFVDFKNPENDYIEWTVPIDVPGFYNLGFVFGHAGFADRFLQLSVNGINRDTVTFSPISSSWSAWSSHFGPNVFLPAGVNKVRATAIGTSGPNIDELKVIFNGVSELPAIAEPIAISGSSLRVSGAAGIVANQSSTAYPNPFF